MIYNAKEYARLRNVVFAISLCAWTVILAGPHVRPCCAARGSGTSLATIFAANQAASLTVGWTLMLIAMMSPMLIPPIYHVQITSLARRRGRLIALFVAGYGAVWLAAGGVLMSAELALTWLAPQSYIPATVMGLVALVWQASPWKQRCLNRCHSHRPLAAFGVAADWDALCLGLEHGFWCTGSCWATMLCPMLLHHGHLVAMAAVSALMFCERLDPPKSLSWRWRGFGAASRCLSLRLRGPQCGPVPLVPGAQA
jgi:predicted metal-binding membrane protein